MGCKLIGASVHNKNFYFTVQKHIYLNTPDVYTTFNS